MKKKIYTILHTHWDFEWFFTDNHSKIQLNYSMKELMNSLEKNDFKSYLLDAQVVLIEDYLHNNPNDKKRLVSFIKQNQIQTGPWYTQSDLTIVSGEAIVKNLELGITLARKYGKAMMIGYVPDAFGLSKDMTQIFHNFEINHILYRRGFSHLKSQTREYQIRGKQNFNSYVYAIAEGYALGLELQKGNFVNLVKDIKKSERFTTLPYSLIFIGNDQTPIDPLIFKKVNAFNKANKEYEIEVLKDIPSFFEMLEKEDLKKYENQELLDGQYSKIHRSLSSGRQDHKYYLEKTEKLITKKVNQLSLLWKLLGKDSHPLLIDNIWKNLLKNHAHDSAAGCNTDATNRHILERYENATESLEAIINYLMQKIAFSITKEDEVLIFNPSLYSKNNELIMIEVSTSFEFFKVFDGTKEISYQIISKKQDSNEDIKRGGDKIDKDLIYFVHTIRLPISITGFAYKILSLKKAKPSKFLIGKETTIEDDFYKISFQKNSFTLLNKTSQEVINDFMKFSYQADDGDSYDFSPLAKNKEKTLNWNIKNFQVNQGKLFKKISFVTSFDIEQDLVQYNKKHPILIKQDVNVKILLENDGLIRIKGNLINKIRDYRLRLSFVSNVKDAKSSISDTSFTYIKRPIKHEKLETWREEGWYEEPTGIYPMINMCGLIKDKATIVFTKTHKEFEIPVTNPQLIKVPILRTIGYLGKPDLQRRPGVASGVTMKYYQTPEAQLINKDIKFEYAIKYSSKELSYSQINETLRKYLSSILFYNNQKLNKFSGPIQFFPIINIDNFKAKFNLVKNLKLNEAIYISNLEYKGDNKFLIRLVNLEDREIISPGAIAFNHIKIKSAFPTTFLSKKLSNNINIDNKVIFPKFLPEEIKTILITWEEES